MSEHDEDDLNVEFGEIISASFDIDELDLEASVDVLLINGTTLRFVGLDVVTLGTVLAEYGIAQMQAADGKACIIFARAVAALVGSGGGGMDNE